MRREPLLGCCTAVVGLTLVVGAGRGDADSYGMADRIAGLVEQLGNDRFARRGAAGKALAAIGRPALPALRKAAASGEDAEVRQRAEWLVAAITRRVAEAELAKWAGSWTGPEGSTLVIAGDRFRSAAPGDGSFRGTIHIVEVDETSVRADLQIEEEGDVVMTAKALFRLDGDTLHYCGNVPEQPRPAEFKSQGTNYYVPWKRAKR